MELGLNLRAAKLLEALHADPDAYRAVRREIAGGAAYDLGVEAAGGLEAGRLMAEVCLGGLGCVSLCPRNDENGEFAIGTDVEIMVETDQPVAACMASQYAGWQISAGKYFAMGSGPMRAAAGREPLFDKIGYREKPPLAVGVLEARTFPPEEVWRDVATMCGVSPEELTLLAAPTASLAGTVQVVARSLETALHKMLELDFPPEAIVSGAGVAPLPPVAKDDLAAIGRTNDAVLYGGRVTVWVRSDDAYLAEFVGRVPSSASSDHGKPFAEIFARYMHDFYKIDPHLFSPAVISLVNLASGRTFRAGRLAPEILRESFHT